MDVLSFITTLTVLVYTLFRIGREFSPEKEVKLLPASSSSSYIASVSYMTEVRLKGLDYGPPTRYYVQGQDEERVWLLYQEDATGKQHSMVTKKEAVWNLVEK